MTLGRPPPTATGFPLRPFHHDVQAFIRHDCYLPFPHFLPLLFLHAMEMEETQGMPLQAQGRHPPCLPDDSSLRYNDCICRSGSPPQLRTRPSISNLMLITSRVGIELWMNRPESTECLFDTLFELLRALRQGVQCRRIRCNVPSPIYLLLLSTSSLPHTIAFRPSRGC